MADDGRRPLALLAADCGNCFGLCCVAPAFSASVDFAIDKPAGCACPHLQPDFRCEVHQGLRSRGFRGCTVYDCFGAGQHVSQVTFGGRSWRDDPASSPAMYGVFAVVRQLHELLWLLSSALDVEAARSVHDELRAARAAIVNVRDADPGQLLRVDVDAMRAAVNPLLVRASELARVGLRGPDHRGADLMGAELAGADLRGANLRGACLIAADLRRADLELADLTGADLRDARTAGAVLSDALFLTQSQLDSASGDASTRLPTQLRRPGHWPSRGS